MSPLEVPVAPPPPGPGEPSVNDPEIPPPPPAYNPVGPTALVKAVTWADGTPASVKAGAI